MATVVEIKAKCSFCQETIALHYPGCDEVPDDGLCDVCVSRQAEEIKKEDKVL